MTSWMMLCTEYFIALRERCYPDESFYKEYDFICHERLKDTDTEILEESYCLQAEIFLQRG